MRKWSLRSASTTETDRFGRLLGALLPAGAVVLLRGELGAGKTALARGVAHGLGVSDDEPVTSPSYTLMNQYRGRLELNHFDLYRLGDPDELIELGFADYLAGEGVTLVEWPERAPGCERGALEIIIEVTSPEDRELCLIAHGNVAAEVLALVERQWRGEDL